MENTFTPEEQEYLNILDSKTHDIEQTHKTYVEFLFEKDMKLYTGEPSEEMKAAFRKLANDKASKILQSVGTKYIALGKKMGGKIRKAKP